MNQKEYRKRSFITYKKEQNQAKELKKYNVSKVDFYAHVREFLFENDLTELVKAMRIGNEILKIEGFPTEEFIKYEAKKH